MIFKGNLYRNLFLLFLLSVFICFLTLRPLNSSWYRIITADALGYYSYLPAQFIYHDSELKYNWFNDVYNQYYSYNSFDSPEQNFMIDYGGKKINKYYPGVSFLQIPFFLGVHAICKIAQLHANGFSLPYQLAAGISSLFYVCLALWYLRKLLFKLSGDDLTSTILPVAVFYGTNLFTYTIFEGTFSHAYSFCFITLTFYFAYVFFNENENKTTNFLLFIFCFFMVVSIRPFNLIIVTALPFFIPHYRFNEFFSFRKNKFQSRDALIVFLFLFLVYYQLRINFIQTGNLFTNTYSAEKFHFERPSQLLNVLFGYQSGWLVYVPVAFVSFLSFLAIFKKPKIIFLFVLIFLVVFLYSSWWYYAVITRTIIDFTAVIAILLLFTLKIILYKIKRAAWFIVIICICFFQLKAYQIRNKILDPMYTYKDYFWKYFFTIRKVAVFPVNPATVIQQHSVYEDFESSNIPFVTSDNAKDGINSVLLYSGNYFTTHLITRLPVFFANQGIRKVKTSFWAFVAKDARKLQLIYKFYNTQKQIKYIPFYMDSGKLKPDEWVYFEFGCDVPAEATANDSLKIYFWNSEGYDKIYIDNIKTEFYLTDSSMEMIP